MPARKHLIRALFVAALAMSFAGGALAQEPAAAVKIAKVSLARIERDYVVLVNQEQSLNQWVQQRRSFHEELLNYVFLSSEAFQEVVTLLQKPRPLSDADQARLDELRAISDEKDARWSELRAKTERTPAESEEFSTLQDIQDARLAELNRSWESAMNELGDRRQTAISGLMSTVTEAIAAEAQAGGFTVVFDADAVFFGGEDITDAVLARLNAEAPPPPGGGGEAPAAGGGEAPAAGGGEAPAAGGGEAPAAGDGEAPAAGGGEAPAAADGEATDGAGGGQEGGEGGGG